MFRAGSLVFTPPKKPAPLHDSINGGASSSAVTGAPYGPRSSIGGLDEHPVVHVAYRDAVAYARWAGKALPTEAESGSPRAAASTMPNTPGATRSRPADPDGQHVAGRVPEPNIAVDGYKRTSPVTAFPANGYGVHDMIGNVWEWTADWCAPKPEDDAQSCCIPTIRAVPPRRGATTSVSPDPDSAQVIKGGSHLCAPNYCRRYRPAARHAEPVDTSTSHVGFRCIIAGGNRMSDGPAAAPADRTHSRLAACLLALGARLVRALGRSNGGSGPTSRAPRGPMTFRSSCSRQWRLLQHYLRRYQRCSAKATTHPSLDSSLQPTRSRQQSGRLREGLISPRPASCCSKSAWT